MVQNSAAAEKMQATASAVADPITTVASIAEENSAATKEVTLRAQMKRVMAAAGQLGQTSASLTEQVSAFKVAAWSKGNRATYAPESPASITDYRKVA